MTPAAIVLNPQGIPATHPSFDYTRATVIQGPQLSKPIDRYIEHFLYPVVQPRALGGAERKPDAHIH
jgi:hypothetical protein